MSDPAVVLNRSLTQLRERILIEGVAPTFGTEGYANSRYEAVPFDEDMLQSWSWTAGELMNSGTTSPADVREQVGRLADRLAGDRETLMVVLHRPSSWLDRLVADPEVGVHATWAMWCWAVTAIWEAINREGSALLETDRVMVVPLAARLRFLVLSEGFRHRGDQPGGPWLPGLEAPLVGAAPFRNVFGQESWHLLVDSAQQARWSWAGFLDSYQSYPPLARATGEQLEAELDALLLCRPGGSALRIGAEHLDEEASAGPTDIAVAGDAVARHLLPRFRLCRVIRLAYQGWRYPAARVAAVAFASGCLALVICWFGFFTLGAWMAGLAYGIVACGAIAGGPLFTEPWMLRWPAAESLGLLILTGFNPHWWRDLTAPTWVPGPPWAPLALALASYGYLVIEVRGHGVPGWAALTRAAGVLAAGCWHALLVALIGLVAVLPAFADSGDKLSDLFGPDSGSRGLLVLVTAAAWCLAAGVFSQILWDDRPITAPLAHASWRVGRGI